MWIYCICSITSGERPVRWGTDSSTSAAVLEKIFASTAPPDRSRIFHPDLLSRYEISLKYSLGKLELGGTNPSELFDKLLEAGFEVADIENRLFATYYQLPKKDNHYS